MSTKAKICAAGLVLLALFVGVQIGRHSQPQPRRPLVTLVNWAFEAAKLYFLFGSDTPDNKLYPAQAALSRSGMPGEALEQETGRDGFPQLDHSRGW